MPTNTFIWSTDCTEASANSTSNQGEWFQKEVSDYM